MKKENIYNIPNLLTLIRVIITGILIVFILQDYSLMIILVLFVLGMLTDFLDGQIARRFNQKTRFGRKFDIIADRLLMVGAGAIFIIAYYYRGLIGNTPLLMFICLFLREILSFPAFLYLAYKKRTLPNSKFIGKLTTFLQGFGFPLLLLSILYPILFIPSFIFAMITGFVGIFSAIRFYKDVGLIRKNKRKA